MTLPVDYANETVSLDNHPDAHNETNTAVNALDTLVATIDTRVTTLEETPAGGGAGGHASFTFNAGTSAPPIGSQIRINNASQTAATTMWVADTSVDGLDVSVGLARVVAGTQIYMQDFDDASKWVKYSVTADAVDSGNYFTYTVVYHSGPANVPFQKVEMQPLAPGQTAVPPGGTAGQVLTKDSTTDYDVSWAAPDVTQAELDAHLTDTSDAHDASAISVLDSGGYLTATDVEVALAELAARNETVTFSQTGTLATGTGVFRWYAKGAYTVVEAWASVTTQPTGVAILVDVNKNGTTVFTTQSNRPTIAVSTNTDVSGTPDVTSLADGDYLTVDIDQIGSTIAGANLTVQVVLRRT